MGLLYSHYEANPVTNNSLKINAVSGTLTKTYKDSYFVRFQQGSRMERTYFTEKEPYREKKNSWGDYIHAAYIIVLQVMLCSDNNYLVEAIDKKDYENMFKLEVENNEESN